MFWTLTVGFAILQWQFMEVMSSDTQERADGPPWSYSGDNGPENWSNDYPNCSGMHQSPIKINRRDASSVIMKPIKFHGYDKVISGMILENNGHTAELMLPEGEEAPYIECGGLGAKYTFSQLHFHWGLNDNEGSEHEIYPQGGRTLEMHMVHQNPEENKNGNAGIAVVGLTFRVSDTDTKAYEPITDALDNIRFNDTRTTIEESFSLESLLPNKFHRSHFYRYNGSLTTPPCTEGVIWSIFEDVFPIGTEQMQKFRSLLSTGRNSDDPKWMAPNFRPIQELNDRTVKKVNIVKRFVSHVHH